MESEGLFTDIPRVECGIGPPLSQGTSSPTRTNDSNHFSFAGQIYHQLGIIVFLPTCTHTKTLNAMLF